MPAEAVPGRQLGLLWGAVALVLIASAPLAPHLAAGLWACPFKSLIGWPCPSCGTTRAALDLARLDIVHALTTYPLPSVAWILFLTGGLVAGVLAWRGRPLPRVRRLPRGAGVVIVLVVLLNWVYSIATGV